MVGGGEGREEVETDLALGRKPEWCGIPRAKVEKVNKVVRSTKEKSEKTTGWLSQ